MRAPVIVLGGIVLVAWGAAVATAARPPMKPMPADCVGRTDAEAHPTRVETPSAGTVAFCLEGSVETTCWSVDLATGRYARMSVPPPPADVGDPPPATDEARGALSVTRTAHDVKVCKTGTTDCRTYAPKGLPKDATALRAAVNDAGTLMVVEIPGASSTIAFAETYDLVTGKRIARFKVASPDGPCGSAELLGDTVMLTTSVCEGPGDSSWLATRAGKKIARVGGKDYISTADTTPVRVDGDVWAFDAGNGGAEVVLQNVRTGAVTKRIKLPADADRGGDATALASDGAGGLVVVTGDPHDGDVLVLDLAAGTLKKKLSPPLCK